MYWDLRKPTSVRDLGGVTNEEVGLIADPGHFLDVAVDLPNAKIRGRYVSVRAYKAGVAAVGSPIVSVQLGNESADSIEEIKALIDQFDRQWVLTPEAKAKAEAFIATAMKARSRTGHTNDQSIGFIAISFQGQPAHGVNPGMVIQIHYDTFWSFEDIKFDPQPTDA